MNVTAKPAIATTLPSSPRAHTKPAPTAERTSGPSSDSFRTVLRAGTATATGATFLALLSYSRPAARAMVGGAAAHGAIVGLAAGLAAAGRTTLTDGFARGLVAGGVAGGAASLLRIGPRGVVAGTVLGCFAGGLAGVAATLVHK